MNEEGLYPLVVIGILIWYAVWFFLIGRAEGMKGNENE